MFKRNFLAAATMTIAVTMMMASSAHATILAPGNTVTPTVLSNLSTLIGGAPTILADTGIIGYSNASETGTYEARVYKDVTAGYLDFVYDVNETASVNSPLVSMSMGIWTGWGSDVYYVSSSPLTGTNVTTSAANDTATRTAAGNSVRFVFNANGVDGSIVAQSAEMVIRVQAPTFVAGTYTLQDNVTENLKGFQPANTPEPASMAMIGAGLLALGLYRRRIS